MRTLLLSITDERAELGFEARVPDDVAERIERAFRAGSKVRVDGVLDSVCPSWAIGTPIAPVWRFFSRLWAS